MTWASRSIIAISLAVSAWFPYGIQLYWLTSNLITLATNATLRMDVMRRRLGIPTVKELEKLSEEGKKESLPQNIILNPKRAAKMMRHKNEAKQQEEQKK